MGFGKRKPVGQLWVRYLQSAGWWETRVSDGNMVVGGGRYPNEFDAIDAAEEDFTGLFPDIPIPVPRIFRTDTDYYAGVVEEEGHRCRKGRRSLFAIPGGVMSSIAGDRAQSDPAPSSGEVSDLRSPTSMIGKGRKARR